MSRFEVGTEVVVGHLPDFTPRERRALEGLAGVVSENNPNSRYVEVEFYDPPLPWHATRFILFVEDELEEA